MNTVNLIGRLTRESDIKFSAAGTGVYKNTLAVNRKFKRDETDFINLLAFSKTAELLANHTNKGDLIGIEGHIQTGSYEKDGKRVYTFDIVVDNVTFLGGKSSQDKPATQPKKAPKFTADPGDPFQEGSTIDIPSDDLPF